MIRLKYLIPSVLAAVGLIAAFFLLRPSGFIQPVEEMVRDFERSEDVQSTLTRLLRSTFGEGLLKQDDSKLTRAFSAAFQARFPSPPTTPDPEPVSVADLPAPRLLDRDGFREVLKLYPHPDRCDLECFGFALEKNEQRAVALYHFHLGGPGIEFQADLQVEFILETSWTIRRMELTRARVVRSSLPRFVDVSKETGFLLNYPREGMRLIQQVIDNRDQVYAGGLSVVDANHDGFPDVIASHGPRSTTLFRNDGKSGFVPESLPESGAYFYLFFDLDGDGREELVSSRPRDYRGTEAELALYTRRSGTWERVPGALTYEVKPWVRRSAFMHITPADIDGDGDLDLFVSGYSNTASGRGFNFVHAKTGERNLLFVNNGSLGFTEESTKRGITGTQFTYLVEFRGADIWVANDFGPNKLYRNQGDGTFRPDPDHPFAKGTSYSMGMAVADYDNTGEWRLYVSNMYSHAGNRIVPHATGIKESTRRMLVATAGGNTLFDASGRERAAELGINQAGWAWGCLFFDLDNDRDKDLYVVNGFTTHSDPEAPDY